MSPFPECICVNMTRRVADFPFFFGAGIPVFMIGAQRFMNIRKIVREKMQNAQFSAMLSLFMKIACSVESQRVARLVGNVDNNEEEFLRQSQFEFDKLLAIQGEDGKKDIDVAILRSKSDAVVNMDGLNIEDLCTFFEQFGSLYLSARPWLSSTSY